MKVYLGEEGRGGAGAEAWKKAERVVAVIQQHTQREKEGRRWKGKEVKKGERRECGGGGCCNTATYSTGEGGAAMERERGERGERREGGERKAEGWKKAEGVVAVIQ